jgi:hypothetical protein
MTVSLARRNLPRRWFSGTPAVGHTATGQRTHRRVNTTWVLPAMLLILCLPTTGWLFSTGTAATAWLVIDLAIAVAGVPLALITMRLFGLEDGD